MDKIRKIDRAEAEIQERIENKLTLLGWFIKSTHGNIYQAGFPDIYCAHVKYGQRWLEVKNPAGYSFTQAQMEVFPKMAAARVGIWIATHEDQVPDLFFKPANWWTFMSVFTSGGRRG
jgi:hypothetical protein